MCYLDQGIGKTLVLNTEVNPSKKNPNSLFNLPCFKGVFVFYIFTSSFLIALRILVRQT